MQAFDRAHAEITGKWVYVPGLFLTHHALTAVSFPSDKYDRCISSCAVCTREIRTSWVLRLQHPAEPMSEHKAFFIPILNR